LDQLTLKSSAELVQGILEGGEIVPELKDLILQRAAGNPLFMEELTHALRPKAPTATRATTARAWKIPWPRCRWV
ncbi:MAG: hypothetical protein R6U95_10240, partial [Bacteroidales bacterium]